MRRKQKTEKSDCTCKDRLETENSMGVPSIARLETKENDGAEELLEKVLDRDINE